MPKFLVILSVMMLMVSCDTNTVVSETQAISGGFWNKDKAVHFTFASPDTTANYNMFLHLRNTNDYTYNNIYLLVSLQYPFGKKVTDTLEYRMANPDGTWLGEGLGNVKESKLWYKEGVQLNESGDYTLTIERAIRNNGEAEGVTNLEGITDVGFSIEVANEQ